MDAPKRASISGKLLSLNGLSHDIGKRLSPFVVTSSLAIWRQGWEGSSKVIANYWIGVDDRFPWQMENFFHFHGNSMSQCWLLDGKNISYLAAPSPRLCQSGDIQHEIPIPLAF